MWKKLFLYSSFSFLSVITPIQAESDNWIVLDPEKLTFIKEGIFINIAGEMVRLEAVMYAQCGLFLGKALAEKEEAVEWYWTCSNGHKNNPFRVRCSKCGEHF